MAEKKKLPTRVRVQAATQGFWDMLGIHADWHGRFAFVLLVISVLAGLFTSSRQAFGLPSAIIISVCAVLLIIAIEMIIVVVLRNLRRQQFPVGTFIPIEHNAIVWGEQSQPGEWVPPGFHVVHGPVVSDDRGNQILGGKGNRMYGDMEGNLILGDSGKRWGVRPY